MEKNFNIGDRVRVVADMERPYYMWVEKGDTGVIVQGQAANGFECVKIDGCADMDYVCVESKYLEADATYDPKTAFLSELKGVLEKHNAEIIGGGFEGYGDYLQVRLGNESPFDVGEDSQYDGVVLTADNIMDYDKE